MKRGVLNTFFEDFITKESLFLDKKVLQSSHTPNTITHRDNEIKQIANILAPTLKLERPSNIFIYGKTGTGKTLTVKYTTRTLEETAKERKIPLRVIYLNCKLKRIADTEYRLIAQMARELGKAIPSTGLPTDEVYRLFYAALEKEKQIILLILDEIDQLVNKTGDNVLYNLQTCGYNVIGKGCYHYNDVLINNDLEYKKNVKIHPGSLACFGSEQIKLFEQLFKGSIYRVNEVIPTIYSTDRFEFSVKKSMSII